MFRFHVAIRRHGPDQFVWQVVDHAETWAEACVREVELIREYGTFGERGYNSTAGGEGSFGVLHSQEAKSKISAKLKAWFNSDDPRVAELRAKVSQVRKTLPTSQETRLKLAERGRQRRGKLSVESYAKMSEAKRRYSDEVISEVTAYALKHGYRAAERAFGIPRITIRRWTWEPEKKAEEHRKMRERRLTRQYGYAFPGVSTCSPV